MRFDDITYIMRIAHALWSLQSDFNQIFSVLLLLFCFAAPPVVRGGLRRLRKIRRNCIHCSTK